MKLFGFDVFALASDGDMQEGLSSEAASLAGHLKLNNLCVLAQKVKLHTISNLNLLMCLSFTLKTINLYYVVEFVSFSRLSEGWIWDNNQITIEGNVSWAMSEDLPTRFIAYGWNVLRVGDANDVEAESHGKPFATSFCFFFFCAYQTVCFLFFSCLFLLSCPVLDRHDTRGLESRGFDPGLFEFQKRVRDSAVTPNCSQVASKRQAGPANLDSGGLPHCLGSSHQAGQES